MKELKFKNCNESYKLDVDGVKIKPYLTWDEFSNIYNSVLAQDNAFMRNFAKLIGFAKACTNINFDGMEEKEIYDICAERGLSYNLSIEVDEYMELDRMIERDESAYNAIVQIIDVVDKKMDGFDVNKIQEGLINLGGELKDVKDNK